MTFTARYPGSCGFCDQELKDTECSYSADGTIVHTGCLIPYATGVDPATAAHRNERHCSKCFQIHAGECL